ncbi:MAG: Cna B-type domain-containing protein [Agathobacter sp.]|nr:Cna B-type domain-containing protein [Agathobacter sp.]
MVHKFIMICLAIMLLLICPYTVAAEEFDPSQTGSMTVSLTDQDGDLPIIGAELSLYYVATVEMNANGNLSYTYTDEFAASGIPLEDPQLAQKLDIYVTEQELEGVSLTTDEAGLAGSQDLALGLYFVRQTGEVEGYAPCTSFLVTIPMQDGDEYIYEVNASPKTEVTKLISITIKKEWNTDASTQIPDQITVQLLRDGNVIKTAILSEENEWQITYDDMPKSDAYSIKEINVPNGFTDTYSQAGYVYTVVNTASLIQTGQLTWPIPVLAVAGIALIVVGIELVRKKRVDHA